MIKVNGMKHMLNNEYLWKESAVNIELNLNRFTPA